MKFERTNLITSGITFGTALAMVVSYAHNHSIIWAIIHGIVSWVYVIYFAIFR